MTLYAKIACDLFRDPKMVAAGPLARLLYIQSVAYCRENLTDGVIDRLLLPLIAVDVTGPARHMDRLVELGALEKIECGWRIPGPVWGKFNPLRTEVEQMRRDAADRKASWRDKQRRDADVPTGHNGLSPRDTRAALGHRDGQPEPEPEGEPEQENTPYPLKGVS